METKRINEMLIEVRGTHEETKEFLLLSDVHFDHPYCDRKLFFKLMDQAKERGAQVLFNGDFFCMMQGQKDRRGAKGKVRPEHYGPNYFNLVVDEAAEKLLPYADNILLLGDGNHETAILRHQEVNPLDMLHTHLTANTSRQMYRMGYQGFVRFNYNKGGAASATSLVYFHHGKYGGVVTMGVLGVKRHAAAVQGADVYWTGHTHDLWYVAHPYITVTRSGKVVTQLQHHIKTGTFKDEFNHPGGFGVEKLYKPAALGGWWMRMDVEWAGSTATLQPQFSMAR